MGRSSRRRATTSRAVRKKSALREWVESLLIAAAIALFVRTFFVQAFKIPSGSMEDTLLVGDFLLVNKFIYGTKIPFTDTKILPGFRKPRHGDIIVFRYPLDKRDFIKRCAAVAGDMVEVRDKQLYVNGRAMIEPYAVHKSDQTIPGYDPAVSGSARYQEDWQSRRFLQIGNIRDNFGPVRVPEGCIFMMGDNRDNSSDSRYWGPLPEAYVKGQAMVIYWSWNNESYEPLWEIWKRVRFTRIGRIIR
jgi:signal peptidase I